jgi:hypothetical protein
MGTGNNPVGFDNTLALGNDSFLSGMKPMPFPSNPEFFGGGLRYLDFTRSTGSL